jgi:hypothetical protein
MTREGRERLSILVAWNRDAWLAEMEPLLASHSLHFAGSCEDLAKALEAGDPYDVILLDRVLGGQEVLPSLPDRAFDRQPADGLVLVTSGWSPLGLFERFRIRFGLSSDRLHFFFKDEGLFDRIAELLASHFGAPGELPTPAAFRDSLSGQYDRWAAQAVDESFVTVTPGFRGIFADVDRAATEGTPLLLVGEPGTGKGLLARRYHRMAGVRGPFVEAVSDPRQGIRDAAALVDKALDGTLYVSDLAEAGRVAQDAISRELEILDGIGRGARDRVRSAFRAVCATIRDLEALARKRAFPRDLLKSLSRFAVRVPPLRERSKTDFELLAEHALRAADRAAGKRVLIHPDALERLSRRAWPRNVREFLEVVSDLAAKSGGAITPSLLRNVLPESGPEPPAPDLGLGIEGLVEREGKG